MVVCWHHSVPSSRQEFKHSQSSEKCKPNGSSSWNRDLKHYSRSLMQCNISFLLGQCRNTSRNAQKRNVSLWRRAFPQNVRHFYENRSGVYDHISGVYDHILEVYDHISRVYDHISGVYDHISEVYDHILEIYDHISRVYDHISGVYDHISGVYEHISQTFVHTPGSNHLLSYLF